MRTEEFIQVIMELYLEYCYAVMFYLGIKVNSNDCLFYNSNIILMHLGMAFRKLKDQPSVADTDS